ncbi:hypothetical protein [Nitrososphaera viennensis]|uniref:hypothetical protein n=1 Tax=Nitrososphaera viennensis TaxID=1034015 RepID=UPI00130DBFCE|nr:hypothetical protein [Nitrososphaera viennensis]
MEDKCHPNSNINRDTLIRRIAKRKKILFGNPRKTKNYYIIAATASDYFGRLGKSSKEEAGREIGIVSLLLSVGTGLAAGAILIVLLSATISNQVVDMNRDDVNWMPRTSQQSLPAEFRIIYQHGVGLDYTLEVENNNGQARFSATTCNSPINVRHATLVLSQQELERIWLSIQENDFFGLTEDFTKECPDFGGKCVIREPSNRIVLEVAADGKTKRIGFDENYALNHDNAELDRFMQVVNTIQGVLDDYENLPESGCAYV